jgi:hypothetical protein
VVVKRLHSILDAKSETMKFAVAAAFLLASASAFAPASFVPKTNVASQSPLQMA